MADSTLTSTSDTGVTATKKRLQRHLCITYDSNVVRPFFCHGPCHALLCPLFHSSSAFHFPSPSPSLLFISRSPPFPCHDHDLCRSHTWDTPWNICLKTLSSYPFICNDFHMHTVTQLCGSVRIGIIKHSFMPLLQQGVTFAWRDGVIVMHFLSLTTPMAAHTSKTIGVMNATNTTAVLLPMGAPMRTTMVAFSASA